MARPIKDLYLSKCIDDLQQRAKTTKLETTSPKLILSSAEKIYAEAEKALLEGKDEELAYYYYFRYVDAISTAQKKEDYKKDKPFYDKLISPKKFKSAVENLEKLTVSLQRRYKLLKDANEHESLARDKEYHEAAENEKNFKNRKAGVGEVASSGDVMKVSSSSINGIIKPNGVDKPGFENAGIIPVDLKNLLEQKAKRILLVDCRDQQDFSKNHIKHSNCISIPATTLAQGMSANAILNTLKENSPESYMDWTKRRSFDCIILYDWNSTFDHRLPALSIVYDALTKWDQDSASTKVLVVQGGMKSMYYAYPSLLTNPQTGVQSSSTSNKVNGSTLEQGDLRKLESISYPDLDDSSPSVHKQKSSDTKESNVIKNNLSSDVPNVNSTNRSNQFSYYNNSTNVHDVPKIGGIVPVDRSTKPTRLPAGQKIPNGTASEMAISAEFNQPVTEVVNSTEKTEFKVQQYSKALDDAIESTKDVVNKEKEVKELVERAGKQVDDEDMKNRLREKEMEIEKFRKLVETRDEQLAKLKDEHLKYLREVKAKQNLPRIRTPPEEAEVKAKEQEKEKLDNMVKEMWRLRIEEAERRSKEQAAVSAIDLETNAENLSRLPPIPQNNSSELVHKGSVIGTPQLPVINNVLPPTMPTSPPISKPASAIGPTVSSSSRPASQDASGVTRMKLKDESSEPPRSSALKRSHSHPNIAQSHDEDSNNESAMNSQVPRINRGLKPSGNRTYAPEPITPRRFTRNFDVVSSTERSKTGLKNLGNTCYMNSVIQCLAHTNKLVDYLRTEKYLEEWHPSRSPTKGEATEELAAAVKQMHSGHRSISLIDLRNAVGRHHRSFRGSEQQDSHEFITIMLDWLHEEMNRVPEKTPLKEQKNDGLTDEIAAGRTWKDYKKSNDSKISELFCGQQKSCVTCGTCYRESVTFEPFFILSVPIPLNGRKCDIQQCIDFYTTQEELVGWNCIHCKKKVRATKKIDLWRLPPYLIIHLQRFYFDGYWKKRLTEIDFPVENLNLNAKVLGKQSNIHATNEYQLYGVSNHYGSMDGGHYTAYCRQVGAGTWCKFDDHEVHSINARDVSTPAAYILFYQNRNF